MHVTNIKLVHTDLNEENQLTFSDIQAQETYFESLQCLELENASYQRKDNVIRYGNYYENLEPYNYCFYENAENGKRYYAYITDLKYINDSMTEIYLKTDVFQTWQFDFIYKKCIVEREHVNNDSVGVHTIREDVETGEYVVNSYEYTDELDTCIYFLVANKPYDIQPQQNVSQTINIGGVGQAGFFYGAGNINDLDLLVQLFSQNPSAGNEAIENIYLAPVSIIDMTQFNQDNEFLGQNAPVGFTKTITKPSTINGYTPKNNKLLTYPYCYFTIDNNNGATNLYHYEKFTSQSCDFLISGVPTCGCSIKAIPQNYTQNNGYNESEGIFAGKYPVTNWNQNYYMNWLSQNGLNLKLQLAQAGFNVGLGLFNLFQGNTEGLSNVLSGAGQYLGYNKQLYDHSMESNSTRGNVNGSDFNFASDCNGFFFYKYSIKSEFAKIIDDYFSMFGYRVNALKVPNITGRTNWNFVKTTNAIVESTNIPDKDLKQFKKMLDSGVTFWHNSSTFLDYSQTNYIVT